MDKHNKKLDTATFGTGCFWCTEAVFDMVNGVQKVIPGYSGGHLENPTYEQVCEGGTGHAEAVQISFDRSVITYEELLKIFWKTHDPTTLNRQGEDIGTQYRSVIFYHDESQKETAKKFKSNLEASGAWDDPVVTSIEPFKNFYEAESYHHKYFANNPGQGYCSFVIAPKIEKFEIAFKNLLKN